MAMPSCVHKRCIALHQFSRRHREAVGEHEKRRRHIKVSVRKKKTRRVKQEICNQKVRVHAYPPESGPSFSAGVLGYRSCWWLGSKCEGEDENATAPQERSSAARSDLLRMAHTALHM
jgi:hypothetical protein